MVQPNCIWTLRNPEKQTNNSPFDPSSQPRFILNVSNMKEGVSVMVTASVVVAVVHVAADMIQFKKYS